MFTFSFFFLVDSERSPLETLLSKQADKIEYLEDHNKRLGQKLVELTQRVAEARADQPPRV